MKNKIMCFFPSNFTPWKLSDYHKLIARDSVNTLLANSMWSYFCI